MAKETVKHDCDRSDCCNGKLKRRVECSNCEGRGWTHDGDRVCLMCDGEKYVFEVTEDDCPNCEGRGFTVEIVTIPEPEQEQEPDPNACRCGYSSDNDETYYNRDCPIPGHAKLGRQRDRYYR